MRDAAAENKKLKKRIKELEKALAEHAGRETKSEGKKSRENEILKPMLPAEKEWDLTFDAVPDLIAILDDHHRVVRVNRAMAGRLGVSVDQCRGKFCHEVVHGLDHPPHFCPHSLTMADGREHSAEVHEDSLGGDFLVSTTPLADDNGRRLGSVHIARDITHRKQAEVALQKSEEDLRRLNAELEKRVEELQALNKELDSFTFSVSHDLRAPLRAINGFTDMLLEDPGAAIDSEKRRRFEAIRENAVRMGQLIDQLLALSRFGRMAVRPGRICMRDLAAEVADELKASCPERNIRLVIREMPDAEGDRVLIRQVFHNLIANAIKFTRPRKTAVIDIGGRSADGKVTYAIKDNGVGFDMKYYDKLFGVFQRLHSARDFEGTGAGLAIVSRIITRHGGRVWGEGKVNEGAVFYFTLRAASGLE